ncbi:MAG: hypothetical protein M3069_32165 [Chloroflexota bacterium]|nr:hypothetical protein [Chloroflexota bacterium]
MTSSEIALNVAEKCLAQSSAVRSTLVGARQSESIQIKELPLRVELGRLSGTLGRLALEGHLYASIYNLGVVVLAWESNLPSETAWGTVAEALGCAVELPRRLAGGFELAIDNLEHVLRPAIAQPARASIVEDYCVLFVERLSVGTDVASLAQRPVVWGAALGEHRPLSPLAARLVTSMSYYPDDLALLSWNGAILVDPDPRASETAADLIEFAQVELLVLRNYDAALDAELPSMYRRIARSERRLALPFSEGDRRLLHDVQRLVAEVTQITERVDNALKVTDDVYWNRLYSAALAVSRVDVWRAGVEHKLGLLRQTYDMLRAEADAARGMILELAIFLLMLLEVTLALVPRPA